MFALSIIYTSYILIMNNKLKLRKYRFAELAYKYKIPSPQQTVAKVAGVNTVSFNRAWNTLLGEEYSVPSDALQKIAHYFGVSMDELYAKEAQNVQV